MRSTHRPIPSQERNTSSIGAEAPSKADKAALMQRAGEMLSHGDFESARLIYAELAEYGRTERVNDSETVRC